jgi:hypothetical protein
MTKPNEFRRDFRLRVSAFAVLVVALTSGQPDLLAAPRARVALIIGNADYQNVVKLNNSGRDAESVASRLSSAGYRVTLLRDGKREKMDAVLAQFEEDARDAEIAFFFYAGHGTQSGGMNYLIPIDARMSVEPGATRSRNIEIEKVGLEGQVIGLSTVLNRLRASNASVKIAVLDCCRTDPGRAISGGRSGRSIFGKGTFANIDVSELAPGSLVVFSTAAGTVAADGPPGGNSPYTSALLESMNPGLSVIAVFAAAEARTNRLLASTKAECLLCKSLIDWLCWVGLSLLRSATQNPQSLRCRP